MAKAVALYEGGITERREVAVREDGAVYSRGQERHPRFGYRWSAWAPTGRTLDVAALPEVVSAGFADLRRSSPRSCQVTVAARFRADGSLKIRLP